MRNDYSSDSVELAAIVLHAVGSVVFTFACVYDFTCVKVPSEVDPVMAAWSGRFKYLTNWNAIMQAMYYTSCLVVDAFDWRPRERRDSPVIVRVNDYVFTTLGFPVALFVSAMFWSLYCFDRNLVMKEEVDEYFPKWLNQIMHTLVTVWAVSEMLLVNHTYERVCKILTGLFVFHAAYIAWIHLVYYKTELWVYKLFDDLSCPLRMLFLLMSIVACFALFGVGLLVHVLRWGNTDYLI